MSDDPFTITYEALWKLVRAVPGFEDIVRPGNQIDFTRQSPEKAEVSNADLPELMLIAGGGGFNLHNTSHSSKILKRYTWITSTGETQVEVSCALQWLIVRAMANWQTGLVSCEWEGQRFIKRLDLVDEQTGLSDPARNRGIRGWSTVQAVEIEMHFATASMMYEGGSSSGSSSS